MRRVLFVLLAASIVTLLLTLFDQTGRGLLPAALLTGALALALLVTRSPFTPARGSSRIPKSQVAEIEKLYFRATREMVTDAPNMPQVINDLQRIVAIDPRYKNARYFLNRALLLQARVDASPLASGARRPHQLDFMALQEKLIDMDAGVRKAVVMELIQYGADAVDPLTALLMDADPDVRIHAATALGWVGGKDAVQPLLVALQDESLPVRRYAARALCWVVDSSAVDTLIAALTDEDTYVRCYAARALGWSHDLRAVPALVALFQRDTNSDVRQYALVALDDLGQPRPEMPPAVAAD
ncbi:MAG: hypothetical protein BroJett033_2550 [Chloroflexota bacterium]|nr:MAG: hypothetical protein BroJett033_2550 [Chloroflexota bacterium]